MFANLPLIAIVDDDAAVRNALDDLLQVAGFGVKAFGGAAEFLGAGTSERFDLIVTDLRMPRIDGIEMIRRLRAGGATTPILVVTSYIDREVRDQALSAGAAECLAKPVDENVLLQRIHAMLHLEPGDRPSTN